MRPQFLGNIGGTARVMKNFGFKQLRFVRAPREYKDAEARKMAVDAIDVLKGAQLFDSLEEALADIGAAFGTTSCQNRQVKTAPIGSMKERIVQLASSNKVALVFGDERDGLFNAELSLCHELVTIPTNPQFPSLNLAQAVGVCAYELDRSARSEEVDLKLRATADCQKSPPTLASGADNDELFQHLAAVLHDAGFTRSYNHERVMMELRSFYLRAYPTERETALLRSAIRKIAAAVKTEMPGEGDS